MILGVGTDIIEIKRIDSVKKNNINFLNKVFTVKEREYFTKRNNSTEVIAGNFAAKEAVCKALGTGIREFSFKDIEILRNDLGKPVVTLYNNAHLVAKKLMNNYKVHLSISHSKENAIAYAILEGEFNEDR